jgi:hypothetical protein
MGGRGRGGRLHGSKSKGLDLLFSAVGTVSEIQNALSWPHAFGSLFLGVVIRDRGSILKGLGRL